MRIAKLLTLIAAGFGLVACPSKPESSPGHSRDTADTVFTGCKIYTSNEKQPWAEAVAIDGNTIVFVGSDADAKELLRLV